MPWKLVLGMVGALVLALFIGFNTANQVALSVGFASFGPIPVYLIILFSFLAGMAVMLPLVVKKRKSDKLLTKGDKASAKVGKTSAKEEIASAKGDKETAKKEGVSSTGSEPEGEQD
jgi:uncharacterized integral membrane protein